MGLESGAGNSGIRPAAKMFFMESSKKEFTVAFLSIAANLVLRYIFISAVYIPHANMLLMQEAPQSQLSSFGIWYINGQVLIAITIIAILWLLKRKLHISRKYTWTLTFIHLGITWFSMGLIHVPLA